MLKSVNSNNNLSCDDLQNSLYLAPSAVRACCKRFFVNGVRKGDVELFPIHKLDQLSVENIYQSKVQLIEDINANAESVCSGCPYLKRANWGKPSPTPTHLSLEYHSVCNLKCTYCSDAYYGGEKPKYNVYELLEDFLQNGELEFLKSISWGGGEPFLDPETYKIFNTLENILRLNSNVNIRIFSNAIRFEERCKKMLELGNTFLTTSIDAGTRSTYKKIRGKDKILVVFENLVRYTEKKPEQVTIKYIITDINSKLEEVDSFVNLIKTHQLIEANFQISIDFNIESISIENFEAAISLFNGLHEINARRVFVDDLVWLRLRNFYTVNKDVLQSQLQKLQERGLVARNPEKEDVIIWGAGGIGINILEDSFFAAENNIVAFVDKNFENIDNKFLRGLPVYPPQHLLTENCKVVIAAAQSYPAILSEFDILGLDKSRLVQGLVL